MSHQTLQILSGIGRLVLFWRTSQWKTSAAQGLNPAQAEILSRLAVQPARASDLAAQLGITTASLSDSISALATKGLATRRPDPSDGRAQLVTPTAEGSAVAARLPSAPPALLDVIGALPESDRAALLHALIGIIGGLQQVRAIPVQRMCLSCRYFHPFVHADTDKPHHCAFVDAAFGDADLRLDCSEHDEAPEQDRAHAWARFETAS